LTFSFSTVQDDRQDFRFERPAPLFSASLSRKSIQHRLILHQLMSEPASSTPELVLERLL
jgi:hypothetical protein